MFRTELSWPTIFFPCWVYLISLMISIKNKDLVFTMKKANVPPMSINKQLLATCQGLSKYIFVSNLSHGSIKRDPINVATAIIGVT